MAEENNFCANCKREIPSVNFVMHSIHCARNITLCTLCEEPVPRSEMDSHQAEFHSLKECESCGEKLDVSQLREHKANICPMRRVYCSICELELPASEIIDHENYCGSRTERCEDCGEYVMLKYLKLHLESNHGFLKLDDEPGPTPSWQSNERVTVNGAFSYDNGAAWRPPQNNAAGVFAAARLPNLVSSSSSKRNNDMPQVNSIPPPHASKSVHKPLIMGGIEKPLRNYGVGDNIDSDVAALFGDSLHVSRPPSYQRRSSGEEDLVALPCEFCEALVPANQLIIHQTACRPDLARYGVPATAASPLNAQSSTISSIPAKHSRMNPVAPRNQIHNNLSSLPPLHFPPRRDLGSDDLDDTLLPCEFCHESFAVSKLYEHQTQCTQTWPDGFNGRSDVGYSFNGRPDPVDQVPPASIPKFVAEYKGNDKNVESETYKLVHKDQDVKVSRHGGMPNELKGSQRRGRGRHYVEKEWTLPPNPRANVRPSAYQPSHPVNSGLNEFNDDGGRQALLKQAQVMEKINAQLGLKKESSATPRNHVLSDLPAWVPRAPKQANHFTNPPNSSHNLGLYPSSSPSSYSQSGRGGRTTGAIPKQKAGTSKSPITY